MSVVQVNRMKRMGENYYNQGEYFLDIPDLILYLFTLMEREKSNTYDELGGAIGIVQNQEKITYYLTNNRTAIIYGDISTIPTEYTNVLYKNLHNKFLEILNPEDFLSLIPSPKMFHKLFLDDLPSEEVSINTIKGRRKFTDEPFLEKYVYLTQEARDMLDVINASSVKIVKLPNLQQVVSYTGNNIMFRSLCLEIP